MARLDRMSEPMRSHIANLPCPTFSTQPWTVGPELKARRISIISTAGLHRRGDRPFDGMAGDYRIIPGDIAAGDLVMTHLSTNFDRTGFQQDWNLVFPIDRLNELAAEGVIGSVADFHYSFMGATETDLDKMVAAFRREVAELRPWYDVGFQRHGRTAVGDFDPRSASELFIEFALGETPKLSNKSQSLAAALRLAAHDLKSFYFEAVVAKPGATVPDSAAFSHWFWHETAAGRILNVIRERCLAETDRSLRLVGTLLLVPMNER